MIQLLLSHPTGNANVRAAAMGFENTGMLKSFITSIALFEGHTLKKLSQFGPLKEFQRREFDIKLQPYTSQYPWLELVRVFASKANVKQLTHHESGRFSIDAVYKGIDTKVSKKLAECRNKQVGIYAYEDGAKFSFREAKRLGLPCFYDLPIGYWRAARRLLEPELTEWPDWASTLTGFNDSEAKLSSKDEELSLADRIFVASTFTANTLTDYKGKLAPISVIPYGFPTVNKHTNRQLFHGAGKLKLLFVGGLSQRKGVANLFAAVEKFGDYIDLTVVGRKASNECLALDRALAKHTWIPSLAHEDVLALMRSQDILIFPSLFEGFGLVITEAMSQGIPVITTDRTAGPDLIEHGKNGWLIQAGSTIAIETILDDILSKPIVISENGKEARGSALLRPWSVYGRELASAIASIY